MLGAHIDASSAVRRTTIPDGQDGCPTVWTELALSMSQLKSCLERRYLACLSRYLVLVGHVRKAVGRQPRIRIAFDDPEAARWGELP
jgi:hypothetical protein